MSSKWRITERVCWTKSGKVDLPVEEKKGWEDSVKSCKEKMLFEKNIPGGCNPKDRVRGHRSAEKTKERRL